DATIAALTPTHLGAAKARDSSALALAGATAAASELATKLAAARTAHEQETAWLESHGQHEPLAAQWPRWDRLFAQAERESSREHALAAELAQAQAALTQTADGEQAAAAALQESLARLRGLEASRQQAIAAVAAFDADKLRAERQALEQRRDSLVAAEKAWNELESTRERLRQAGARAHDIGAAIAAANTLLAAAVAEAGGIDAARAQAERSCEAAKLACGASVTKLRSTLEDGLPCPVCGSEEHPYQHQDETLQAMLASLEAEVERSRALAAHNLAVQSTQRAVVAANEQQLAAATREQSALAEALQTLEPAWAAHPLAAEAPAEAGRAAWFAAQQQQVRESAQQLDAREQALHSAAQEREQAQAACDRGAAERDRLGEAAAQARTAAAQAAASNAALAERRAQTASNVAAVLDELDDAFADGHAWRGEWNDDAVRFRAQCASFAAQWASHTQQQAALAASLAAMEIEKDALQKRCEHAEDVAVQARAAFAQADTELQARQRERAALWDGRPVREVEAEFAVALDAARLQLASQQAAREKAAHAETRSRESLAHNTQRLGALQADKQAAAERLDAWLAGFGDGHPELEAIDAAALAALLELDSAQVEQERRALSGLDASAASAAAVLAERRERHALHQQGAPADAPCPPAELPGALAALLDERKLAHDGATALRLRLAQDNVRRENSQAVAGEIEAQRAVERRWGQMNELIGSADGKKFRNYAQQFTLDVLLGYANSHLAHLARRYRLERVATSGGPSLGLLVRDQDMGGEIRSVNSLSGGESFLVSLALALGLASLSSNRVRVESLFIDEGFGSLDSETLRVAMDALDGLQSMGRKVGVISHVQEMTERIATKILVQPAGGGTSSVTVQ
ncbi:MAG: SbcC/MukB-like Walker B domain-containing protein, partial [Telluria sp.]